MISKELLSEVLGQDIIKHNTAFVKCLESSKDTKTNNVHINYLDTNGIIRLFVINIYELAHKCKEWLWSKNIDFKILHSRCHTPVRRVVEVHLDNDIYSGCLTHSGRFRGEDETEVTAIIKSCEWILENKDES